MNASWTISAARSAASSRPARHIRTNRHAARDAVKGVRATKLLTPARNTGIRQSSIPTKHTRTTSIQMHRRNRRKRIANRRIPAKNLIRRRKIISAP